MALNLITGPVLEPVSLDEAKSHCRVTSTAEDGLLIGYIMAARQHVESVTGRSLITQTWDFGIDRHWPIFYDRKYGGERQLIELPRSPVQSVTSVKYVDTTGTTQTLDPTQYKVFGLHTAGQATGGIPGIGRIEPAVGVYYWPLLYPQGDLITVRFIAGYGDAPGSIHESLRQAMLLLIGFWFDNRLEPSTDISSTPLGFAALIAPHRVWYGEETHFQTHVGRLWA